MFENLPFEMIMMIKRRTVPSTFSPLLLNTDRGFWLLPQHKKKIRAINAGKGGAKLSLSPDKMIVYVPNKTFYR